MLKYEILRDYNLVNAHTPDHNYTKAASRNNCDQSRGHSF